MQATHDGLGRPTTCIQGKYLTLGVLRTKRDWINSGTVIMIGSTAVFAYMLFTSFTRTRADARRRAAERDLGVEVQKAQ
jgi:hypothetical protein